MAIKILKPDFVHDDEVRARTIHEANLSAKLSHPNIVPVLDVGTDNGIIFYTMPLLDSGDLKSFKGLRNLGAQATAKLYAQIAAGLAYAHGQGIIHRDIKPGKTHNYHDQPKSKRQNRGCCRWKSNLQPKG
ncbi:MAG: protein kinase [Planctomycetota bacterium]|nr:protein kinase [Planctomycetota bacterium]